MTKSIPVTTPAELAVIEGGASRKRGKTIFELALEQRERVAEEQRKLDVILEEIRESYPTGKYEDGDAIVTVSETLTLDKKKAAALFPGAEYQELTYTAASLKAKLTGEQYRSVLAVGKPKVVIARKDADA
jgi:hypothetical protein